MLPVNIPPIFAAGAATDAFVLCTEISLVCEICPAKRASVDGIFISLCRTGNYRSIQLGVITHGNLIAAFARIQSGLLLHAFKVGLDLVLTNAQGSATGHAPKNKARTTADIRLFRVVFVRILQTGQ